MHGNSHISATYQQNITGGDSNSSLDAGLSDDPYLLIFGYVLIVLLATQKLVGSGPLLCMAGYLSQWISATVAQKTVSMFGHFVMFSL